MEQPTLKKVPRPGSGASDVIESTLPPQRAVAWRKISLFATPVVVGLINLGDAYNDRQKAVFEGDQLYREQVESGNIRADEIREAAQQAGQIEMNALVGSGTGQASSIISASTSKANEIRTWGQYESALSREQAKATRESIKKLRENGSQSRDPFANIK